MTYIKRIFVAGILGVAFFSCKDKFVPKVQSPNTGYLVVEGFINSGGGQTMITLTRTTKLYDTASIIYDNGAQVMIESNQNQIYPLSFEGNGTYVYPPIYLDPAAQYRLRIITEDHNQYVSDYSPVRYTPPIDSLTWKEEKGGLQIYVSTHDPTNVSKYYRWDYSETWEFHSAYLSNLKYTINSRTGDITGVKYRDSIAHKVDSSIYTCWHTTGSTTTTVATTTDLSTNLIYTPLQFIGGGSQKLSVLYSIYAKQYAISEGAYNFYENLKKNTQNLGSIFDPQPSQLQGNIHCTTDTTLPVVGYVEVNQEQDLRAFISNASLGNWVYNSGCEQIVIPNKPDTLNLYGYGRIPIRPAITAGLSIVSIYASDAECVDCTLTGTNIKPSFWP